MKKLINQLWGSAFDQQPDEVMFTFTTGRDVHAVEAADKKLLPYDLWVNKAHALMLYKQGIIQEEDASIILKGLLEIEQLAHDGKFTIDPQKEDVHTNVESWLTEKYGIEHAGKLHTARSRNDQTNTDTRLYLRDQVINYANNLLELAKTLTNEAEKYKEYVMPGFTHHQQAMMTTFGHTLLAFASMTLRDTKRFISWYELHNTNTLGNVVAYGTSFKIDQEFTSKLFGFEGPDINSMDQITNRWEAESDLAFAIVILMNHLSLMAQTLIIMSTVQFNMITISDKFSTGSSIMPQKRNPDPLEIIKGKASFAAGSLQGLIGIGKASFIGFNRDTQWTKYLVMDVVEECALAPTVLKGAIETMEVNREQMEKWCHKGFIGATHLLEQLVSEYKIPFRSAKIIVEKAVKYSKGKDKITLKALKHSLKQERVDVKLSKQQVKKWQDPFHILSVTKSFGSPGLKSFDSSLQIMKKNMKKIDSIIISKTLSKAQSLNLLCEEIKKLFDA